MDDSDRAEAESMGFREVFLDYDLDVAGSERMEIENVSDRDVYWFGLGVHK